MKQTDNFEWEIEYSKYACVQFFKLIGLFNFYKKNDK